MSFLIALIILLLVGGIIYLKQSAKKPIVTREEFLNELTRFVEGQTELHREYENSFKVRFSFEGYPFVYEDVELPGFGTKVNKAYLKLRISGSLTLQFYEKAHATKIINQELNPFKKIDAAPSNRRLKVPDNLRMFEIQTNNVERVNKIFANPKFNTVLNKYKNTDPRGYYFMALNIISGVMILTFFSDERYNPNLISIKSHIEFIEEPLKDLISLHKILNQYS